MIAILYIYLSITYHLLRYPLLFLAPFLIYFDFREFGLDYIIEAFARVSITVLRILELVINLCYT